HEEPDQAVSAAAVVPAAVSVVTAAATEQQNEDDDKEEEAHGIMLRLPVRADPCRARTEPRGGRQSSMGATGYDPHCGADGTGTRPPMVERKMAERHLAQAERTAALGRSHIERQAQIVAELERGGHDATQARELLEIFKGLLQVEHEAHRDRLL